LPAAACRLHGYLYLVARPVTEAELRDALELDDGALKDASTWLADYRLVERDRAGRGAVGEAGQEPQVPPHGGTLRGICRKV